MKRPQEKDFMEANIESSIPAAVLNTRDYIKALESFADSLIVEKKYSPEEIIKELKECDHIDDAISFFSKDKT